MRISINVKTVNQPFGGANNFAKNLFQGLISKGYYVTNKLDKNLDFIIIVVSHDSLRLVSFSPDDVRAYKKAYPNVRVIHRINTCDEQRAYDNGTNKRVIKTNEIADHTIFVSKFMKSFWQKKRVGIKNYSIILTYANTEIFNPSKRTKWNKKEPLKIVTHHWSPNYMKGFDIYQRLDEMITLKKWKNKIKFTFIGRTPLGHCLKNSKTLRPLKDSDLSKELKYHHVYITASRYEPAGNHYIEAIQCGLPVLHLNHGSLPEYCKDFGITFELHNFENKLSELIRNYEIYFKKLSKCSFNEKIMIEKYCILIEKLSLREDKLLKNKPYLIYFYKIIKILKKLRIRLGKKLTEEN